MSFDVYLESDGCSVEVERFSEGGTYALGGSVRAELNITYNYSSSYYEIFPSGGCGLRWLDGKTGAQSLECLRLGVLLLGTDKFEADYWAPTPGNAGYPLSILLAWAEQYPNAVWCVS